jgi:hypothetical protein
MTGAVPQDEIEVIPVAGDLFAEMKHPGAACQKRRADAGSVL